MFIIILFIFLYSTGETSPAWVMDSNIESDSDDSLDGNLDDNNLLESDAGKVYFSQMHASQFLHCFIF